MTTLDVLAALLVADPWLQGLSAVVGILGASLSGYLTADAWRHWRAIRGNGHSVALRCVAWQGVRTQAGIGVVQLLLALVSLAVLTLPPVPAYQMGEGIVTVIVGRKLVRLLVLLVLAWVALTSARTRRQVVALLLEGRQA